MFDEFERVNKLNVITLDEAKDQCNIIDYHEDDVYLQSLIFTAVDMVERYTKCKLSTCRIRLQVDCNIQKVYLRYPPIDSVESVLYGEDLDLTLDYKFNKISGIVKVDTSVLTEDDYLITYLAGYPTKESIPPIYLHACKIIIADLYLNRESSQDVKMTPTIFNALRLLK